MADVIKDILAMMPNHRWVLYQNFAIRSEANPCQCPLAVLLDRPNSYLYGDANDPGLYSLGREKGYDQRQLQLVIRAADDSDFQVETRELRRQMLQFIDTSLADARVAPDYGSL